MKNLSKNDIVSAIKTAGTLNKAAKNLNIDKKTLYNLRKKYGLLNNPINTVSNETIETKSTLIEESQIELLKERNNQLQRQIKDLKKDLALKEEEFTGLWNIKNSIDYRGVGQPEWLDFKATSVSSSIPTLMCSDEHWGEVVFKDQVNGVNEYNKHIARKRYNNVINNYLKITNDFKNAIDQKRMVLILGGDNVSGDIHEELSQTNDLTVMEAVYDYVDHKIQGIKTLLAAGYKQIFIPCVSGNHDRLTKKIYGKMRNETSCAYIVYRFLQKTFADDKRVVFSIAGGLDSLYSVNNHRMLLTHGDQFKGGNGIGGITIPILRGFLKKLASFNQTGNGFDSMAIGHFHQFTSINNGQVIINGSLKGYDEYSQRMGFQYQEPCQAFWLTHPHRGITMQLPIYSDNKEDTIIKKSSDEWISWKI